MDLIVEGPGKYFVWEWENKHVIVPVSEIREEENAWRVRLGDREKLVGIRITDKTALDPESLILTILEIVRSDAKIVDDEEKLEARVIRWERYAGTETVDVEYNDGTLATFKLQGKKLRMIYVKHGVLRVSREKLEGVGKEAIKKWARKVARGI